MSTEKRLGGEKATAKGKFLNHLNFGYAKHISVSEEPSDYAVDQLLRMNIAREVIDRYCGGIEFDCMNCVVHAVCMKNLNGGLEIYSDLYCQSPVTFGKNGITFIKGKPSKKAKDEAQDRHLLLFADFVDFFAYESLHGRIFKEIPDWSDVLILNQAANLNALLSRLGDYDHLNLLLPLSIAGRTLSKTIESLYGAFARNCSGIYSCFPCLADFTRHKDVLLNASKIKL